MKDQILKIAKVKNEAEFYRKFPTEEAFMAKHGKQLKKAAMGAKMVDTQLRQLTDFGNMPEAQVGTYIQGGANPNTPNAFRFGDALSGAKAANAGITKDQQLKNESVDALAAKAAPAPGVDVAGGMSGISDLAGQFMGGGKSGGGMSKDVTDAIAAGFEMRYGGDLHKFQGGGGLTGFGNAISSAFGKKGGLGNGLVDMFGGNSKGIMDVGAKGALGAGGAGFGAGAEAAGLGIVNAAPQILQGIDQMKQQQANIKKADQSAQISGLTAQAAESQPQQQKRKYVRPEDALVQPGQLGNPQGAGTNYLAQYGARIGGNPTQIQNTYAPTNTLYDDLGYEPLNDSTVKQFQKGGKLISRDKINIDSYGNQGTAFRDIFQNPNMTQDTTYAYDSPSAMLRYNTNGGNPNAYIGGRGGFTSAQPDSLAKYKQLLSSPFNSNEPDAMKKLAGGKYEYGGDLPTAEFGDYFQSSGQASIGKGVGSAIGSAFFGPVGGAVGGFLGGVAGNVFGGADDANKLANFQTQTKQNTERSAWAAGSQNIHAQNASFMEDGGWVSNDWQPQIITTFGEHKLKDLLRPPHDADMLRAGGHLKEYTPPSAEAMFTGRRDMPYEMEYGGQMAMGGDLQVHRGEAETMSHNPYLPGNGETVMFRGPSHDNGGMPISYGQNGVEVEGGEPAIKLQDGGQDENLVVFGNMKINKFAAQHIEDPKAEGKKYKNYVADLSKMETKQNNLINKSTKLALDSDANSAFDQLSLNSAQANIMGANMKLKDIANKKQNAAAVQNAILDTAQEHGIESDALAQGKIKPMKQSDMAKFGAKMETAQQGITARKPFDPLQGRRMSTPIYNVGNTISYNPEFANSLMYPSANQTNNGGDQALSNTLSFGDPYLQSIQPIASKPATQLSTIVNNNKGTNKGTSKSKSQVYVPPTAVNLTDNRQGNYEWTNPQPLSNGTSTAAASTAATMTPSYDPSGGDLSNSPIEKQFSKDKKNSNWGDAALMLTSGLADYFRPTRQFPLDPSETMAEQYALGHNQVDPVYAQTFQPMLDNPYDISLQDQVNAIDAQTRAAMLNTGGDPTAQAYIAAQANDAKNKVLGEQFRLNQGQKAQTYSKNRELLNQSALQNLGILDNQQDKQSKAKSATKAQTIAALSSISDKVTRNKQENLIAAIEQNRNNFRIDSEGRAINFNTPAQFNMAGNSFNRTGNQQGITTDHLGNTLYPIYNKDGSIKGYTAGGAKNGAKIKARNSSIVKAVKSL